MQTPPAIHDLLAQFLAQAPHTELVSGGEVEMFDAVPAQAIDAAAAWKSAMRAVAMLAPSLPGAARPADWPNWVAHRPPLTVVLFATGSYPQAVRDVNLLLKPLAIAQPSGATIAISESDQLTDLLAKAGLMREMGRFDEAIAYLNRVPAQSANAAIVNNEQAAIQFAQGQIDEAVALWSGQPDSAPVLYNLGVAALVQYRLSDAAKHFASAVAQLPDTDPWHHLGQLYLAVAGMGH